MSQSQTWKAEYVRNTKLSCNILYKFLYFIKRSTSVGNKGPTIRFQEGAMVFVQQKMKNKYFGQLLVEKKIVCS